MLGLSTKLERLIKQSITKPVLFEQAFKHGGGVKKSYERLEFLGDSILQSLASDYLYHQFPNESEGKLTEIRSRLVRRSALNLLGYRLGLGDFISSKFLTFDELNEENRRIFGDTLESLVGAVYLNSGYTGAKFFVDKVLIKRFVKIDEIENSSTNYKGQLVELSQKLNFNVEYLSEINPDTENSNVTLLINDEPITSASSTTKKKAEQKAAKKLLKSEELLLQVKGKNEEE